MAAEALSGGAPTVALPRWLLRPAGPEGPTAARPKANRKALLHSTRVACCTAITEVRRAPPALRAPLLRGRPVPALPGFPRCPKATWGVAWGAAWLPRFPKVAWFPPGSRGVPAASRSPERVCGVAEERV